MENIVNMTPHAVVLLDKEDKVVKTFEPSGSSVRLSSKTVEVGKIGEIRLTETVYGNPEGLPEEKEGTWYIVSALVKSALPCRHDLLVPAEQVRDSQGRIIGCRSLGI